eukprot:gnl/MRDRNA2_/MRDRNA2_32933_c0_seq1.p1 gnl/MRDRNA2_/MRDRNA2_32933_c0~~gnl/MRDRNA2_/MRDRNA2_32933_c0_seq1.p1  ORF type:complete len:658 (+),score=77.43 gnl/MRDRNA2_/MRDRNA2_32933_c0_seq1:206-2179(+)
MVQFRQRRFNIGHEHFGVLHSDLKRSFHSDMTSAQSKARWRALSKWFRRVSVSNWVFMKPFIIAVIPTMISVAMKWYERYIRDHFLEGLFPDDPQAYSSLCWVLSFVLVFRTGQAYNRYWDGAQNLHRMTVELYDASAQMIAFAEASDVSRKRISAFQLSVVRLFSLLHGVALQQVTDVEDEDIKIIDPGGLDSDQLLYMRSYHRKLRPDIVMQWIIRLMTEAVKSGVVSTPAPIVSRAYQECNAGLVALSQMRTIAELPFPVPYAKMVWILLLAHLVITPFYVVSFTNANFWAGVYSFTSVFSLWCIHYIAMELEQPFGDGVNNLDLASSQTEMNQALMILLDSQTQWAPDLEQIEGTAKQLRRLRAQRLSLHSYATGQSSCSQEDSVDSRDDNKSCEPGASKKDDSVRRSVLQPRFIDSSLVEEHKGFTIPQTVPSALPEECQATASTNQCEPPAVSAGTAPAGGQTVSFGNSEECQMPVSGKQCDPPADSISTDSGPLPPSKLSIGSMGQTGSSGISEECQATASRNQGGAPIDSRSKDSASRPSSRLTIGSMGQTVNSGSSEEYQATASINQCDPPADNNSRPPDRLTTGSMSDLNRISEGTEGSFFQPGAKAGVPPQTSPDAVAEYPPPSSLKRNAAQTPEKGSLADAMYLS